MASVEVNNIVAGYGDKLLIRNLSFIGGSPVFIAIIGHNGSGKTTLFKALTAQIAFTGSIHIYNHTIKPGSAPASKGLVALLAQKNTVSFSIPVKELVVMGRFRLKRFFEAYNSTDYKEVITILDELGMSHLAERNFLELSGGEQQMIWLAQLMVQDARVYLLDEPTQQLDVYNKKRVFELMMSWVKNHNKTVLCITHDLHYLEQMEGYLLNLSAVNPVLEPINHSSVERNIQLLENKQSF
ncbi:ABC transporter ATP-binding protein [Rhodocytophaga rosea]|uniref:ABC transporter ATP-binding protein n=1 Tax=Rhodocytophaga rosea TaxID=2704465 RepID=A0A6C0GKM5_9BACT|nr:ABC transporter ATP-binding protein [Rhodocytophaga rosea]QHT68202.1 ABC transporter ATP-binding protein [Rhodocytophaga rosea]